MSDRLVVPFVLKLDAPLEEPDELSQLRAVPLTSLQRLRVGASSYVEQDLARSGAFAWAVSDRLHPLTAGARKTGSIAEVAVAAPDRHQDRQFRPTDPLLERMTDSRDVSQLFEANVIDLANVIMSEAGGQTLVSMIAVGFAVHNRMARNHKSRVREVWGAFSHVNLHPKETEIRIAREILSGRASDPTRGATHFYTPDRMPREGAAVGRADIRGGLESIPGVIDPNTNQPYRNYKPGWAIESERVDVPGVLPSKFRFYKIPGIGPVR